MTNIACLSETFVGCPQQFRCGLLLVVFLVSGGVALLFSGQGSDGQNSYRIEGFLLTLLSGMLAGLKWTLSQVRTLQTQKPSFKTVQTQHFSGITFYSL